MLDWQDLFTAFGLMLVLEGLFMFASPGFWRKLVLRLQEMNDGALRMGAFSVMVIGLVIIMLAR